jgi:hypothetical protein
MKFQGQDILNIISSPSGKRDAVKLSDEDIGREIKLVELNIRRERLKGYRQDREERKSYANKVYWLLCRELDLPLRINMSYRFVFE